MVYVVAIHRCSGARIVCHGRHADTLINLKAGQRPDEGAERPPTPGRS